MKLRSTAFIVALLAVTPLCGQTQSEPTTEYNGNPSRSANARSTGRIIVKWRGSSHRLTSADARTKRTAALTGLNLKRAASESIDHDVFVAMDNPSTRTVEHAAAVIAQDADVEYASVEYRRKAHALTNDPLLTQQWYLLSEQAAATRTDTAWDVTQGSATVVVAVLDSGVRFDHPDLGIAAAGGKLLPGYDFVTNAVVANDGGGRDADASDPGDWVTVAEAQAAPFDEDCLPDNGGPTNSSWHGTRVAGLIGAQTNNASGVAGNAWNTQILPVRVLGKCGGSDLDIIDGMRWAAGLQVGSLPLNPTPAKIINLSLGGEGACTAAYQSAVNAVLAAGSLVVASAGNEGNQVSAPANCAGVLGVAGLRHIGTKVGFSNLGPEVGIGAPGGNCVNVSGGPCLFSIVVATNSGTQSPSTNGYTDQLNFNLGTSFSAPMAASAAALLKAVNPTLTPPQTILLLKDSAMPFPSNPTATTCEIPSADSVPQDTECNCTTETCGAGMLNTGAAIASAQKPLAVLQMSGTPAVGSTIALNASSSFASQGHSIVSYQWAAVNVTGVAPTIASANQASTSLQFTGESQLTLRLTVTDEQGTQDMKEVALATPVVTTPPPPVTTPIPPPAPAPPSGISGGGSGGGGGQFGFELLLLGLLVTLSYRSSSSVRSRISSPSFTITSLAVRGIKKRMTLL